ncbi:tyrosine-type recombinase/integrase [Sedimentibacter hydroxybenzoicus DSM 7310]|uniref:Tyrosine-type recombinase/integrase n=1 Tax=Sedimentibacter hydroxybenzoicus DSM 7310 TaxID=1123245 RepID=A0A974BMX6_SEDHY|nr:tyrosine-type recombinase/integrase [Sedimentibacter hydroxybenzoicus]NYB76158.1 tyrosine-type recombinase/integrase [Sedimentibacter hydroxybenzoicus DSM 7310]
MSDYPFTGPFAAHIKNHVQLKQAIGYKYTTEENHLLRFSAFTAEKYPNATGLTKEIVLDWCSKKYYESQGNQCSRASIIRQLAIYMDYIGMNTYVLPKGYYPTEEKYIPYIYTEDELKHFFDETDKCHYVSQCPHRHLIMPIFFRMIYSCGLRSSEARLLKVDDIDLEECVLTIEHSKMDNARLVPMSDEITSRCRGYFQHVHVMSKGSDYFFPGLNGKPMTLTNIYRNFRRFLWKAGISHGGRGKGPRVHDFRHTFACHCLKNWVMQGKDLSVYLPVLKTFMGHDSFEETAYYLRMTADVFPDISIKLEGFYPDVIPTLEGDNYETY